MADVSYLKIKYRLKCRKANIKKVTQIEKHYCLDEATK